MGESENEMNCGACVNVVVWSEIERQNVDECGYFVRSSLVCITLFTLSLLLADASRNPFSQSTVTTDSVVFVSICKFQTKIVLYL